MGLESSLARCKPAVPTAKRSPNVERLSYVARLSALMHQHLSLGREDCRRPEARTSLLRKGIPSEQQAPPAYLRPDTRWVNKRVC